MPKVKVGKEVKHFPYTKKGKEEAEMKKKKEMSKMAKAKGMKMKVA